MSDKMTNFVKDSSLNSRRNSNHHTLFGTVDMYIINPLPKNVDVLTVIEKVEKIIPPHIAQKTEGIYVGNFKEFEEKQVNAMYKDGTIYISSDQDDNDDMIDDIIHEFAHHVEMLYPEEIYGDGKIKQEFRKKRSELEFELRSEGYWTDEFNFLDLKYDYELDDFLYKRVGKNLLRMITTGMFVRPYASVSLREYFATGFEQYFLGNKEKVKRISPELYNKLEELSN